MPQPWPSGSASPSLVLLHPAGSCPLTWTDPQQLSAASSGLFCHTPASWPERGQGRPSGSLGQSGLLVRVWVDRQTCHSVPPASGGRAMFQRDLSMGVLPPHPSVHILSETRHLLSMGQWANGSEEEGDHGTGVDVFPRPACTLHLWEWQSASPLENHPPFPHS